jgi:hypothetical protein
MHASSVGKVGRLMGEAINKGIDPVVKGAGA